MGCFYNCIALTLDFSYFFVKFQIDTVKLYCDLFKLAVSLVKSLDETLSLVKDDKISLQLGVETDLCPFDLYFKQFYGTLSRGWGGT